MKSHSKTPIRLARLLLGPSLVIFLCLPVGAQWPFALQTTPDAQRNALQAVRAQVNWLQNATRTSSSFGAQGYSNIWEAFQQLRHAYGSLKLTLTQQQLAYGANYLAELDAGLDIIQEAFTNYEDDLAAGQPFSTAFNNLCRVMRQASAVWLQEMNKTATKLRIG